jgi:hypothetical protein
MEFSGQIPTIIAISSRNSIGSSNVTLYVSHTQVGSKLKMTVKT